MPGVFQLLVRRRGRRSATSLRTRTCRRSCFSEFPREKDEQASGAYAEKGIVQKAVRAIKKACPELVVITDVCLCEYMSHGHCGVTRRDGEHFHVLNDESVELLAKTAVSHARSRRRFRRAERHDGRPHRRDSRSARCEGFSDTGIMSYAAKFASAFYGPFREAAESPPQFGDRRSYQMDPRECAPKRCAKRRSMSRKAPIF